MNSINQWINSRFNIILLSTHAYQQQLPQSTDRTITKIIRHLALCVFCSIIKIKMQRWEEKQRQRAHHYMVEQAKPTIKRYSGSREKPTLSASRARSSLTSINMPFRQVLTLFQLQQYESLLQQHGFPSKIKDKDSMAAIDVIIKDVKAQDQDRFYSLMSALLSISSDIKATPNRKTPMKKTNPKHYPPLQQSYQLKKCESIAGRKPQKTTFRIKSKSNYTHLSPHQSNHTPSINSIKRKHRARDDSVLIHDFGIAGGSTVKYIGRVNGVVNRIEEKLKQLKGYQQRIEKAPQELFYKEIGEMYLSYDSATLTSNIANIDIEQMVDCYSIELEQRLSSAPLNPQNTIAHNPKIGRLLKQSLLMSKEKTVDNPSEESMDETISAGSYEEESSFTDTDFFQCQVQSVAKDLSVFDYNYEDNTRGCCSRGDMKNFIQLVMMGGKMQKETPIIAYAYLRRILKSCRQNLTPRNWKNLTLITLIQASKIWDDQSLENHSFAKAIHPYTTLQINRLQRHLLALLEYRLQVEPREYCQSYFALRRHAGTAGKTAHLMNLSLQTIRRLQAGNKKAEPSLKRKNKQKLNESF